MTESSTIEVMLLRSGDTSTAGKTVTFQLPEDGEPNPFRNFKHGKNGDRFELSVKLIADDESRHEVIKRDDFKAIMSTGRPAPLISSTRTGYIQYGNDKPILADASTRENEGQTGTTVQATSASSGTTSAAKPKREMTLAQRIGMICSNENFFNFIKSKYNWYDYTTKHPEEYMLSDLEKCAGFVRRYCGVNSRSDIKYDTPEAEKWRELYDGYDEWLEKQT